MARRQERTPLALAAAMLLASALIHLVLLPIGNGILGLDWDSPPVPKNTGFMEVSLIDPEESADDEAQERDLPGNLVNLDRVPDARPPEETDKIAEVDSRVDKETKAPSQRPRPGQAPRDPGDAPDATEAKPTPPSLLRPSRADRADASDPRDDPQPGLAAADDGERPLERPGTSGAATPGAPGSPRTGVRGDPSAMRDLFGRPGTQDDLHTVDDESAESLLNARQFKYSSFFNRVRDGVGQHWHPEVIHAARDPEGRVYGTGTRITRLQIRLHPDGSVQSIRIDKSAGVDYLDEEAVRAVRAAQPFANPPPGLIDPKLGLIDFGFAFIFEIGKAPRIHRYRR